MEGIGMIMAVEWIWQLGARQVLWDRLQGGKVTWCDVRTTAREGGNVGAGKVENIGPQEQENFAWETDSISFIFKPGLVSLHTYCSTAQRT